MLSESPSTIMVGEDQGSGARKSTRRPGFHHVEGLPDDNEALE